MLIAMAITLVMMAAVVTLFANVSNSVRNRRATIELSGQLRHARNVLQQDLQGATCPGSTWQRSESNHGYIELVEGQYREGNATNLINGNNSPPLDPEIDHAASILPTSNMTLPDPSWATDAAGLGDYDDILMLTVRNEHEPFVGRVPRIIDSANRPLGYEFWDQAAESIESTLAEVIWFAIENPDTDSNPKNFFGEPGMRTVYRRTLLIAPWLNPYQSVDDDRDGVVTIGGSLDIKPVPGLLRVLPVNDFKREQVAEAISALVDFQERFDISARVEWDHKIGHWKIVANTLADLTKRENRFGHYGYLRAQNANDSKRVFPYALVSIGLGYAGSVKDVVFIQDPEIPRPTGSATDAEAQAHIVNSAVATYTIDPTVNLDGSRKYSTRPFGYIDDTPTGVPATVQAMLNDDGEVIRVLHGPVPLWGKRRGEDVMMTNVLAFDVRVFDPGAPLFATVRIDPTLGPQPDVILSPSDQGWRGWAGTPPTPGAYTHNDNMKLDGSGAIGTAATTFPYVGQGAYVDMGYGFDPRWGAAALLAPPRYVNQYSSAAQPWFFTPRAISDVYGNPLAPGYAVYDTWSFHYENNGVDEDADTRIDQGTNGLDDIDQKVNAPTNQIDMGDAAVFGVDDVGERETTPPYDKPLRGAQVIVRAYEPDARSIRQVKVNQHFLPE
jgi:hypothetical protein